MAMRWKCSKWALAGVAALATWSAPGEEHAVSVPAVVETAPVPTPGDAADDPCIWVDESDPARSLVIGTDKKGGLAVYDLGGRQLQYLPGGRPNNVDLRHGVVCNGGKVDLVATADRSDNRVRLFAVDRDKRVLKELGGFDTGTPVYGMCLYVNAASAVPYVFVNTDSGHVEQWAFDVTVDGVKAHRARSFEVGSQTEGCVADDTLGAFYVAEEGVGIWHYGAEPDAGTARTAVDSVQPAGSLVADVEGLALYDAGQDRGYLIASSQGDSTFAVYRREKGNARVGSFRIAGSEGIDEVTGTDGIDVVARPLGGAFPAGLFVAQDDENDGGNQNFKLVSWQAIAQALGLSN